MNLPRSKTPTFKKLSGQVEEVFRLVADREAALFQILEHVLRHFRSETGTIHSLDAENQLLRLVAQRGLPPAMLGVVRVIPVGKGIAGQTAATGKPVSICNLQSDKSGVARPGAKQTGVGGALCVPLRAKRKLVGTLGIGTIRQHEYTPRETRALEKIGRQIGAHSSGRPLGN